ncbi:hypothetical protein ELD05_10665 [Caldicellulosiruptor changbaiensis]|uniref:Uncharacterized protein n=1 Tax=Caldicellulosiruptor changbaiensis TaxID=1222016 RepID=A0A3T0D7F0_9FIRM|nr:hypothetical protein [Caldicellulosiruptor changbaiensis]AZT91061.1 hypothetical protein ELD05_10665 [Caldicellulosiruptor changbaiensis]
MIRIKNGAWFFTAFVLLIAIVWKYIKGRKLNKDLIGYYIPAFLLFLILGILDLFSLNKNTFNIIAICLFVLYLMYLIAMVLQKHKR